MINNHLPSAQIQRDLFPDFRRLCDGPYAKIPAPVVAALPNWVTRKRGVTFAVALHQPVKCLSEFLFRL